MSATDTKPDEDLSPSQLATLRRKKNADAQAAFRSRRANYIANLEETVTRLEYVVRELQDNCREARDMLEETKQENTQLRATINSLRQAERERERVWRALNNRGNPQATLSDTSSDTDGSLVAHNMVPMHDGMLEYSRSLTYPQTSELVHQLPSPPDTMNALPNSYDAYNQQMINYPLFDNQESNQWPNQSMPSTYPIDDQAPMSCSPGSQIVIPELADEGNAMVRYHNSPGALATFDPSVVAMRHPSTPASERADSSAIENIDPQTPRRLTRSRAQFRRSQSGNDPYPSGSSERRERRRGPRESTPDGPAFSDTLAVIKAQAFGTARKTRTRANRGVSEHAARVAMEVLEARGLSLGVSLDGLNDRRRRRSTRGAEDDV